MHFAGAFVYLQSVFKVATCLTATQLAGLPPPMETTGAAHFAGAVRHLLSEHKVAMRLTATPLAGLPWSGVVHCSAGAYKHTKGSRL